MSLGIFSFDLAALIDSLYNFIDVSEPEPLDSPPVPETSLDKTENVLQDTSGTAINDALMAAALTTAVTSVISSAETVKMPPEKTPVAPQPARPTPPVLDDETRQEIERLIRELQTTVIHNYQSTDIIDETVSLNNVANFPRRKMRDDSQTGTEFREQQRKAEDRKLEQLREELKRAILRNNNEV